jgi:aminoglycoside phosphotransferase (APT) family kinase protein
MMQNTRERGGAGVEGEIRALLARHLPGYGVRTVAGLGSGANNAAYGVNNELVVRASKEADPRRRSESTRREAELLAAVAGFSTLPVPEPVFADAEAGVLAYFKLPGLPLVDQGVEEPARLAPALGEFIGHLHRAPLGKIESLVERDFYPLTAWLEDAERDYRQVAERVPAADRRLAEDFLGRTPPAELRAAVFCHNDLGAEHVLADARASAVTGVIDWTDAAIADPARDLALIYRDLGPEVFDLALAHYGHRFDEADRSRADFYARCKLLEDVAYGVRTPGAARYAEAGLAHLARTFT